MLNHSLKMMSKETSFMSSQALPDPSIFRVLIRGGGGSTYGMAKSHDITLCIVRERSVTHNTPNTLLVVRVELHGYPRGILFSLDVSSKTNVTLTSSIRPLRTTVNAEILACRKFGNFG